MKLISVSFLLLAIPIIILGVLSYQTTKNTLDDYGASRLENSVAHTIGMIASLNEEVEKGNITLEDAQEKVKVTILGELQEDGTRPINTDFNLGENGYLFITDYEGTSVAHPTIEGENSWDEEDTQGNKFVQEYINEGISGGGFTYYDYFLPNSDEIAEKVNYTKAFPEWEWVVGAGTYMMDFNKPANSILNLIFIVIGATLVIGITIIWFFANNVSKPINVVTEYMNNLARGDLSQEELIIKSKDETGKLANALNRMQDGLKAIIGNVSDASSTITSRSEELTQAANEVSEGSEQMVTTMEELATGSETQANHSSDLATMMSTFVMKLEDVNKSGEHIQQSSKEVIDMTKDGSQLMEKSTKQMEMIDSLVHDAVAKVEGLDTHSQEISELVSMIHDIAEQTNLLALNAAIEAARAGEHGQGFAVVADEVRKLAEESSNSVTNITEIVSRIQTESSVVASSLRDGYKEVEQGTSQIIATGKTFQEISNALQEMVNNINDVSNNLADIAANGQEMNSAIEDIAAISEESAAGIEETTATTQQTNAAMEEVADTSKELTKLADELNGLVEQFKI